MTVPATTPPVRVWHVLWGFIRFAPWRYTANLILWSAMWLMPIIPALLTREYFNRLEAEPGFDVSTLVAVMLMYGLGRLGVMWVGLINDIHLGFRWTSLMRQNMLERVYELPGAEAVHESPGDMITRFREDVDHVQEMLEWTVDMVGTVVFAAAAAVVMSSISVPLTVLVFAPLVAIVLVSAKLGGRVRRYRTAAREATGRITGMLGETFGSVQSIKVVGAEDTTLEHFRGLNDARRRHMVRDRVLTATLESVFWNSVNIGIGLTLIVAAGSMADGSLGIGDFAMFVFFLDYVSDAGFFVGLFIARYKQAAVSLERIAAIFGGAPIARLVRPRDLQLTGPVEAPERPAPRGAGLERLDVTGITYHYPTTNGAAAGITDVTLSIPRGSFTVVTGRVGAGKTTLLRAILGLVEPAGGEVRWNGTPVTSPAEFFLPPRTAYVPQVPRLFSMTLRENLLLGRDDPDEDLLAAIREAEMELDLSAMPGGLDTMVGPLGMRLSGGQIQRTATARALLRRPDLLVIDDLSSALDVETEKAVWDRLFTNDAAATALVVSHRRPALERADQIVVIDAGRAVATGTYQDLLAASPEFRALWEQEESGEPIHPTRNTSRG